jgi:hypothetical protein
MSIGKSCIKTKSWWMRMQMPSSLYLMNALRRVKLAERRKEITGPSRPPSSPKDPSASVSW